MSADDPYLIKLVRDDVEASMENPQHGIVYKPIENRALLIASLRRKLGEEAVEYLVNPGISELADILDAVEALAELDLGVEITDVEIFAEKKRMSRGGFRGGMGMWAVPR